MWWFVVDLLRIPADVNLYSLNSERERKEKMEFHENEDQEEEIGIQAPEKYGTTTLGSSGRTKMGSGGKTASPVWRKGGGGTYRYRECLKNHAVGIGGHAVDGCREFMAAGETGTLDALKCAACDCHRNFHRKEAEEEQAYHQRHHYDNQFTNFYYSGTALPAGYLHHVTPPPHQRPLALPSTCREEDDVSNPSSSGGGGGSGSKKRFRTKFSQEQKDRMLEFAERLGWRFQKHDDAAVQQFCEETGVRRQVLKVWMHNNKHTVGKKP
ncbi:hypothetical protein U1Q18_017411 [Sarracenia purpurea var. burkii]